LQDTSDPLTLHFSAESGLNQQNFTSSGLLPYFDSIPEPARWGDDAGKERRIVKCFALCLQGSRQASPQNLQYAVLLLKTQHLKRFK
jgi:hypothetical protein